MIKLHKMDTLSEFLKNRLSDRGKQSSFSRRIGVSQATASRWVSGDNVPDFESCLRIADYFKLDPLEVFEVAGKSEYERLYKKFFPDYEPKQLDESDIYKDPKHAEIHSKIQQMLLRGMDERVEREFLFWQDFGFFHYRFLDVLQFTEATGGRLVAEDATGRHCIDSLGFPFTQEVVDLVEEAPDDWDIFTVTSEGNTGPITIYLYLRNPESELVDLPLIRRFMKEWLDEYVQDYGQHKGRMTTEPETYSENLSDENIREFKRQQVEETKRAIDEERKEKHRLSVD